MPVDTENALPDWKPSPQVGESDMSGDKGVDPDDNAPGGEQPLFRPHAFALKQGDGGADIAYGQFMWRFDVLQFNYTDLGAGIGVVNTGVGQPRAIKGWETVVPNLKEHDGAAMSASPAPNKFPSLDAYGDVYLYWYVDSDDADFVTKCWVQVGDVATADLPVVAVGSSDHDRLGIISAGLSPGAANAYYRIKIGNVPDPSLNTDIVQNLSSDVYWPTLIMIRDLA